MKKQPLIVTAPVANLRKEPIEPSFGYINDDLQKTQLLYNEILLCNEERGDWYNVEATEQKKAAPRGNWCGYPGWVKKESAMFLDTLPTFNAVVRKHRAAITAGPDDKTVCVLRAPIGARLTIEDAGNNDYYKTIFSDGGEGWVSKKEVNTTGTTTDVQRLRQNIVETAKLFLNMPYLWGGRSAYIPIINQPRTLNFEPGTDLHIVTGVDCSGLTNLVYRVHNLDIPRDACDQWSASIHIAYDTLEAADLIFVSAEGTHDKIIHVMLYIGGEEFIEASETGSVIAINSFEKKFGVRLHDIAAKSCIVDKKKIVFASILKTGDKK
ncbi:MAG: hypothetical protein C0399_11710 [Syntrophus sp. (in: bacteria)]|nr:hypothetical protein [Syntrophus sp. (in: bacteria)]